MLAARGADKALGLASTMVLTRLLVPEDFGLVAMALAIVALLELLTNFSLDVALIQHPSPDRTHFDTAWTLGLIFGILIASALLLLAQPAAAYYRAPRVESLLQVMSAVAVVGPLSNIGCVNFRRELAFDREFRFVLYRRLATLPVTIGLALVLRSYWALVLGTLFGSLAGVAISYAMHPFRPRLSLSRFRDLFHVSQWMFLNNLLQYVNGRAADFLIGRMQGPRSLGIYSLANEFGSMPTVELIAPVNRAAFPGYSRLAAERGDVVAAFLNVFAMVALIALPASAGIALVAHLLVPLLFGSQWVEAAPLMSLLALASGGLALWTNPGFLFLALGRVKVVTALLALQAGLTVAALAAFLTLDIPLAPGWASLTVAGAMVLPNLIALRRFAGVRPASMLALVWRPVLGCFAMALVLGAVDSAPDVAHGPVALATGLASLVVAGALTYVGSVAAAWWVSGRPSGAEAYVLARLTRMLARGR